MPSWTASEDSTPLGGTARLSNPNTSLENSSVGLRMVHDDYYYYCYSYFCNPNSHVIKFFLFFFVVRLNECRKSLFNIVGIIVVYNIILEWVTKETALLHSYFTAGALWALATDCQSEKIVNCVCIREGKDREQDAEGNLLFYTCNANVDFARHYLDTFVLNNLQNNGSIPALVNWQNSIVGINVSGREKGTTTD